MFVSSCLFDLDDEVRDRVVLFLKSIEYDAPFSTAYKFGNDNNYDDNGDVTFTEYTLICLYRFVLFLSSFGK